MVSSRPGFFIVGKSHAYLLDKIDHIAGIAWCGEEENFFPLPGIELR
jgi:hypothetical protein